MKWGLSGLSRRGRGSFHVNESREFAGDWEDWLLRKVVFLATGGIPNLGACSDGGAPLAIQHRPTSGLHLANIYDGWPPYPPDPHRSLPYGGERTLSSQMAGSRRHSCQGSRTPGRYESATLSRLEHQVIPECRVVEIDRTSGNKTMSVCIWRCHLGNGRRMTWELKRANPTGLGIPIPVVDPPCVACGMD